MSASLGAAASAGFLIGAGLIIAIGAQNAFVLRQGLLRRHVLPIVLVCAASDALLISAGVGGLGNLVTAYPLALQLATGGGIVFLLVYGWLALRRALQPQALAVDLTEESPALRPALVTCMALTFGNPHVYLDTVVLVGSLSAPYPGLAKLAYGLGAVAASFTWFIALGYGARLLTPLFAKPLAWRLLDGLICLIMWGIAGQLALWLWHHPG